MKTRSIAGPATVAFLAVSGLWTMASAGDKSDFALFDGTNPANQPTSGAVCGGGAENKLKAGQGFTYHVTLSNYGADGFVRITYADGDFVQYKIPADGSFHLSQAAGSKGGADAAIRVSNGGSPAVLAGSMSALSKTGAFCVSCDADSSGDAGCDDIVPN